MTVIIGTMKVFVSYSHQQQHWVEDYLVVVLEACGHEVLWDRARFSAGTGLDQQERNLQQEADVQLLCLSPSYLASRHCVAEMERALKTDPDFRRGTVIPLLLEPTALPDTIRIPDPLVVTMDLERDKRGVEDGWALLGKPPLGLDLNIETGRWLEARDKIRRHLERKESVNLVVPRRQPRPAWRNLINHLEQRYGLSVVDFESGVAASRVDLVQTVLEKAGSRARVPDQPRDLPALQRGLEKLGHSNQAWLHFCQNTKRDNEYQGDFYAAIRHLISEEKVLTLLVHSKENIANWMERAHQLSLIDFKVVEL